MLLEAKAQLKRGEWRDWLGHFRLSHNTAKIYMNLAQVEKANALAFSSLGAFVRKTSNPNYNKPQTVRWACQNWTLLIPAPLGD